MKISTTILQEMVSKSIKGAGLNKLMPITGYMNIELVSGVLTFITTDYSNYLYVSQEGVEGEDMNVVVRAEQFSKLVSKLTADTTILEVKDGSLHVKANGEYKLDIPQDEDGDVTYPNPYDDFTDPDYSVSMSNATIQTILKTAKNALATTMENPCYTGYYMGDGVIATDSYKICYLDYTVFDGHKVLLAAPTLDLVGLISDETFTSYIKDDIVVFTSSNLTVYAHIMPGIEDYAVDGIMQVVKMTYAADWMLDKNIVLNALDRIALFVGNFDDGAIELDFDKELTIRSVSHSGVEVIKPMNTGSVEQALQCKIDINMLLNQVKAVPSNSFKLYYGNNNMIKLVDKDDSKITYTLSLLADSNDEA